MANMQQAQGHQPAPQPQQRDKLGEFQRTKPPTFSHSIEPMDADDWMKTIEKKLQVIQCNNREKVPFASHQLEGPAADLSYPVFMPKPSTHRMHDPGSNVPHIRPKVLTGNQMS
jgi:hypothetical protein